MKTGGLVSVAAAALVATIAGVGGTLPVVLAAAQAVGATPDQASSWVSGLGLATAASALILSVRYRMPIITAWSTPGAALIASTSGVPSFAAAVGAFVLAALLILLTAAVKPLGRLIGRMPPSIAAAMLGGILLRLVMAMVEHVPSAPLLVLPLIALFLVARLFFPALASLIVLVGGALLAWSLGLVKPLPSLGLSTLVVTAPAWDVATLIGLGVPLYLVTMASQNLPGFAVLRANGYQPPVQPALLVTGIGSTLLAPFGSHAINMAAITASIVTGPDCHPDPKKRWLVAWPYLVLYGLIGLMAASFVHVLGALPKDVITAIAGLALFSPLMGGVTAMMKEPRDIESALVTFLVTASGLTIMGVGSAFWGLVAGLVLFGARHLIQQKRV